jgi:hypothetical protein
MVRNPATWAEIEIPAKRWSRCGSESGWEVEEVKSYWAKFVLKSTQKDRNR